MSVLVPILTGLAGLVLGALGAWLFDKWKTHYYGEGDYK